MLSPYWDQVLTIGGVHALAALGLYVAFIAGQFSVGHGALVAAGAYSSALVSLKLGLAFPLALVAGGLGGAAMGVAMALLLSRRLSGLYLAIATLAFQQGLLIVLGGWDFVGGSFGLAGLPLETALWQIALTVLLVVGGLLWFESTAAGNRMRVVGADPIAARSLGLSPARWITLAWAVGGCIAGVSGAFFAFSLSAITPHDFGFVLATNLLVAVVLGGLGSPVGTVIAALFIAVVPEALRDSLGDELRAPLYGLILLLVVIFRPDGLISRRGWRAFVARLRALLPSRPRRARLRGETP